VFGEARKRFAFELRGFRLEREWLSFYIKPADGLLLPVIMQWLKQTFAVRFNLCADRTGHVWGDRYWSRVLDGAPPAWAAEVDWEAVEAAAKTGVIFFEPWSPDGVCPGGGNPGGNGIFVPNPRPIPAAARLSLQTRPRSARNRRHNRLTQRRQPTAPGEVCPLPNPAPPVQV
jgi:hypothetical protein